MTDQSDDEFAADPSWRERISPQWHSLIEAINKADGDEPAFHTDGSWRIAVDLVLSVGKLLRTSPVDFVPVWKGSNSLYDDYDNDVEEETGYCVEVCEEARAILVSSRHWQAGDSACLTVCTSNEAYVRFRDAEVETAKDYVDVELP